MAEANPICLDWIALEVLRYPSKKCLDLLCEHAGVSVRDVLAAKHAFFTGDAYDARELECTDEEYRAGYELYVQESIAAKAPWAKLWQQGETK